VEGYPPWTGVPAFRSALQGRICPQEHQYILQFITDDPWERYCGEHDSVLHNTRASFSINHSFPDPRICRYMYSTVVLKQFLDDLETMLHPSPPTTPPQSVSEEDDLDVFNDSDNESVCQSSDSSLEISSVRSVCDPCLHEYASFFPSKDGLGYSAALDYPCRIHGEMLG